MTDGAAVQGDKYGSRPISELDVTSWEVSSHLLPLHTLMRFGCGSMLEYLQRLMFTAAAPVQGPSTCRQCTTLTDMQPEAC